MKKLLTFFLTALLAFGVGWAETYSHSFGPSDAWGTEIPQTVTLSNISWTLDGTYTGDLYLGNVDANKGKQFGSGSRPFSALSLSTTGITGTITSITVNASTASSATANLSVTVGGTSFINSSLTSTATNYTGTGTASGEVVISMTQTTSKALYIKSISITYTPGAVTPTCATPTFSPGSGTYSEAQTVTISSETAGATIVYTVNNGEVQSGTTPVTVTVSETSTIEAYATMTGYNDSETASASYTITGGSTSSSTIYRKVTRADDIVVGQKYILVYEGSTPAFMGEINSFGISVTGPTISNSQVDIAGYTITEWTLGGTSTAYTFTDGNGNYISWSSGNSLATSTSVNNNSSWTIGSTTSGNGGYILTNVATNTRILQYNTGSPRFACYTSSQAVACLYVQESTNPTLQIAPPEQTISDAAAAELSVTGANLTNGIAVAATPSTNWTVTPASLTTAGGTVSVSYTGRDLAASTTVEASSTGATSVSATVNYRADVWILTDGGVTDAWDYSTGTAMSYSDGVYTADFPVTTAGTFIVFTRKLGESYPWDTRYLFGPESTGNWWLTDQTINQDCALDLNDDDPIYFQTTGLYTITINVANNTFKITKRNIDVTISPADGTTFTGETISGTITSDPAGTIEWSTDGTNWQSYSDGFTATVAQVGQSVTVYARSTYNGVVSDVAQATYTRDYAPAPAAPTFSIPGGAVAEGTEVTITAPEGCTLYVDGNLVTSPYTVTITQGTTITAYSVNSEGTQSEPVSYSFTIAAVCHATVEFKDNGSDSSNATTWNALYGTEEDNYFNAGRDYLSNASDITRVYKGETGLKFGNSSNGGTITFDLNTTNTEWKVTQIIVNAAQYGNVTDNTFTVTTSDGQTATTSGTSGSYALNFNGSTITSITISSTARVYLKGFTLTYDCAPTVEAPVITPGSGTYYEDQTVHIVAGDGCTIYYTTDGSDPTTSSTQFTNDFTAPYTTGSTTIKAIAVDGQGNMSAVTEVTYTWGTPSVNITPDSRNTTASSVNVTLTGSPANATIYYTTDGSTPSAENGTEYTGAFSVALDEIGSQVTVNAIAVVGNLTSAVASATYTRVENVIDVNAPFFSPLVNQTYYGDQTLQIGCTTPNADIYYLIEEDGTAGQPSKTSIYYEGQTINMTVGHTYHVTAIAYIGNYASTVSEGTYTIVAAPTGQYAFTSLKDFNDNCPTGVTASFVNPVQVVYQSTYTNNGEFAEFCYVRDNTDYACIYFGKRDNTGKTIFKMGDWIDGSQISGKTNIWDRNFHIQLGTNYHEVDSWPTSTLGWSEIIPEEMTNDVIVAGTDSTENVWGHYVHLRYTTLREVDDYSSDDPKHTGKINDGTADAYYYDKFYRWSAGTCSYTYSGTTYEDEIQCLGDYDQAFFTAKQNAGATFDVYGIVDYYKPYTPPFEMCPIDFLWIYKPVISLASGTYTTTQTVTITATQPEWAAEGVVIYYKTDDMEEWAVYTPGDQIIVNSDTHIQAYAEVPAEKTDGTNYNDYVRSEVVEATYDFAAVEDPTINEPTQVVPVVTGNESLSIVVTDHNEATSDAVTIYYVNGVLQSDTISANSSCDPFIIRETTTVTAVSFLVVEGDTLWSNTVTHTYTFARSNGIEYNLLKTAPVEGNIYVIVNKAANMAMSDTQNATNRGSTGVLFKDGTNKDVVYGNDEIAQFVLEQISGNRYYFKNVTGNGGYLCVETNAYANLVTTTAHEAAGYDVANVTIGANNDNADLSYPATITFTYEGIVRYMRYYANGRTFSTYTDASLNQPVFLYGAQVTPLHVIERDFTTSTETQVTVSDRLIGVWAAKNMLWAKDQGYASIDATQIREGQLDYVKSARLKSTAKSFQFDEWDQSNWVMLDFSDTGKDPSQYVGKEFDNNAIVGYYTNAKNYTIKLAANSPLETVGSKAGYLGYTGDPVDMGDRYVLNHYVPCNFYVPNLNWGEYTGATTGEQALETVPDTAIFFMNPKIQEIAQVWAVWNGGYFTVYEHQGTAVNGYDLTGAFNVDWTYNRRSDTGDWSEMYGDVSETLLTGASYLFHVAVMRDDFSYGHRNVNATSTFNAGTPKPGAFSAMTVYPLDIMTSPEPDPTGIEEVVDTTGKTVVGVSYFNVMGQMSDKPFDGINIIVTRYSDGSRSTVKVLR